MSRYHPLSLFVYFAAVVALAVAVMQPVCLLISLLGAASAYVSLAGWKAARGTLIFALPVFLVSALVNPLFSHEGATILFYFSGGNPFTLESAVYGVSAGLMLAGALIWFRAMGEALTSEKLAYLFGGVAPTLALLFSMTLRLAPRFTARAARVYAVRRGMGETEGKKRAEKLRAGLSVLSVMITWALEDAADTALSMRSRGYGLPGRTHFSMFRFTRPDALFLFLSLACAGCTLFITLTGRFSWQYYPVCAFPVDAYGMLAVLTYGILCFLPAGIRVREAILWRC